MTAAVSINRTYRPRLVRIWTRIWSSKVWVQSGQTTVVATRRETLSKPKSRTSPVLPDGWRMPLAWEMDYTDSANYPTDAMYRAYNYANNYWQMREPTVTMSSLSAAPCPPPPAWLTAQAEVDALVQLKDEKVNVGVSFGERAEVAGMMLENFGKIKRSYTAFRKGQFRNAARHLGLGWKDAPNRWLEYQYGWKPLLGDIYTACEEIQRNDYQDPTRTYSSVKERKSSKDVLKTRSSYSGYAWDKITEVEWDVKVRFDFRPNPDKDVFRTLDQWGIANPLQIGWELVPFSFVVDWALPVGDFLSALTAGHPYLFRSGSLSHFTSSKCQHHFFPSWDGSIQCYTALGDARSVAKRFRRSVYTTFPFPDIRAAFHAHARTAQAQTIATRTANALSILSSMFK